LIINSHSSRFIFEIVHYLFRCVVHLNTSDSGNDNDDQGIRHALLQQLLFLYFFYGPWLLEEVNFTPFTCSIHFIRSTPLIKFNLLPQAIIVRQIYILTGLTFVSLRMNWVLIHQKNCEVTYNMMAYVKKLH
jgi:hypothetical protein